VRVTIFGATGTSGRRVVDAALAAGHEVAVLVRDPARLEEPERLRVVVGEISDAHAVEQAIAGSEGVIWAVGPTSNTPDQPALFESAATVLVDAMRRAGARRLVALSGAGVTLAGERKPLNHRLISRFVGLAVRHVVDAKRREYEVFAASGLEVVLVRPPRVVDGPATGQRSVGEQPTGARVTSGDLAEFMVEQLADRRFVDRAPYVSS
jgi:putative NADH-flavin reductase